MWPQDIDAQLASTRASEAAEAHGESGIMDEPHSYNFGLCHAGLAAEEAGDKSAAGDYHATLLKSTGDGARSTRPELTHAARNPSSAAFDADLLTR